MSTINAPEHVQAYSFVLRKIDLLEKSLRLFNKRDKKVDYDYGIKLEIAPNPSSNQSLHLMTVTVTPKGNEKEVIATVRLGFVFEIANLESIIIPNGESMSLPQNLLNLLNAVVIGTMRGVLYSEFRGTILDDAILPVLDPSKFSKTDI